MILFWAFLGYFISNTSQIVLRAPDHFISVVTISGLLWQALRNFEKSSNMAKKFWGKFLFTPFPSWVSGIVPENPILEIPDPSLVPLLYTYKGTFYFVTKCDCVKGGRTHWDKNGKMEEF